jgi:hypothetical protein
MATYVPAKRATELIFYMGLVSQSTGQFQANPTLAAGDVKVSKDGGALANLSALPAVTPAGSKMVKVTLSGTEMTADNVTLVFSDAAGAEWDDCIVNIQTAANQIDDLATPTNITAGTITTATNVTTVNGLAANVITAASIATGAIDADAIADNAIDAGAIAADAITAAKIADGAIDAATFAAGAITATVIATDAIDADAIKADAVTEIQSGLSTLTAAGVRTAIGLATANLDTQLDALPTNAELATALGTADDAVLAAVAAVQSDTNDIQTRLPAALSGDGFIKADLKSIEDELTDGNNATLKLKKLEIVNDSGIGIQVTALNEALYMLGDSFGGDSFGGVYIEGGSSGIEVATTGTNRNAVNLFGSGTGKAISAPKNIAVSDGVLTLAAIAAAVWANATRTLTAISDSAGITTLLTRIASALSISGGKVESNVKQVNDVDLTGDGSGTPWGPA